MHENVKTVPSLATNFTTYATPDVRLLTVVAGIVMVHVDCTDTAYGGFAGQPAEPVGFVIFTP
jgi:hypothetical protein